MTTKTRPYGGRHHLPCCRVTRVTDQPMGSAVGNVVVWTAVEYDLPGIPNIWDGSTALFAPVNGVYHVETSGQWGFANVGGARYLYLVHNGGGIKSIITSGTLSTNWYEGRTIACDVYLTKGDYMQVHAYQTSGSNLPYAASAYPASFSMRCIFSNTLMQWGEE